MLEKAKGFSVTLLCIHNDLRFTMAYRNDPSSLSFGARLSRAEQDAAQAKTELAELKQSLPNNRDLQAAAISGEAIKSQRKSAKQMMSRADASLAELSSIDPAVLTPAYKEQLRMSVRDAAFREMLPEQQPFQFQTPAAQARFETWKASTPLQDFQSNNVLPGEQNPQRPVDLWKSRQDAPEGRYQRNLKRQQELNKDQMLRRAEGVFA